MLLMLPRRILKPPSVTRRWLHVPTPKPGSHNGTALLSTSEQLRMLMRRVTQPVVLVTTDEEGDGSQRRGLTVSSFTTICLTPSPFVCFSTRQDSRAAFLISVRGLFIVHLLPCNTDSAKLAEAFSRSDLAPHADPAVVNQNPFDLAKWRREWGLSILDGAIAALLCSVDKIINVGDHRLFVAEVKGIHTGEDTSNALAYCQRKYRGEGKSLWPHDPSDEDIEEKT